jgi:hypothetical protein
LTAHLLSCRVILLRAFFRSPTTTSMAFSTFLCYLLTTISCLIISQAAGAKVCSSSPYKDLLFLSKYAPAQSYCTAHYPLPTTTVTVTAAAKTARAVVSTTTTSAAKVAGNDAVWSSILSSAKAIVSTVCSCIDTRPTKTVRTSVPESSILIPFSRSLFLQSLQQRPATRAGLNQPLSCALLAAAPLTMEVGHSSPTLATPMP